MHPGGVADDADITSGMVEAVKLTQDGIGELVAARGDFSTLAGRLNVSLNSNGTLKANTVGASQIVDASVGVAEISTAIAGNGLSGGAGSPLSVFAGVNEISSAIAGNGLSGGSGSPLSVNVDDDTIGITSDSLRVKGGGIGYQQIKDNVAGDGLTGGTLVPLSVVTDGETTGIDGDGAVEVIGIPNNSAYPHKRIYPVCARYNGAGQEIESSSSANMKFATEAFKRFGGVGSIPTYAVVDNSGSYTKFQNKDPGVVILEPKAIWRVSVMIDTTGTSGLGDPTINLTVYLRHTQSDDTLIEEYLMVGFDNDGASGGTLKACHSSVLVEMAENDRLYFHAVNDDAEDFTLGATSWIEFELMK